MIKMRLIAWIVVDYLIDLFNRNSRDYRQVSKELALMKSEDKIHQQEERIRSQASVQTVGRSFTSTRQENDMRLFDCSSGLGGECRRDRLQRSFVSVSRSFRAQRFNRLSV